jgi:hypothetical protein
MTELHEKPCRRLTKKDEPLERTEFFTDKVYFPADPACIAAKSDNATFRFHTGWEQTGADTIAQIDALRRKQALLLRTRA